LNRAAKHKPVARRAPHKRKAASVRTAAIQVAAPPERPWLLNQEEITLIKNSIAKGASDEELKFCLTVARRYHLDPFKQQIWFVSRWDKNADNGKGGKGAHVWTPQVGINGLLFAAARDHAQDFGSVSLPEFGPMITIHGTIKGPEWARVKVWKKGSAVPTEGEAWWTEYAPADMDKAPFWRKMPRRMIGKCATALAIRQAYPDLGGLYIPEECERMNEDFTPAGRQIVEKGAAGAAEAAQAVARRKIEAYRAGGETLAREQESERTLLVEAEKAMSETITITFLDDLTVALRGSGLDVARAELTLEDKEELGIKQTAQKGVHMPAANAAKFIDRAAKFNVLAKFAEAGN
jgi:hypothetical protein